MPQCDLRGSIVNKTEKLCFISVVLTCAHGPHGCVFAMICIQVNICVNIYLIMKGGESFSKDTNDHSANYTHSSAVVKLDPEKIQA